MPSKIRKTITIGHDPITGKPIRKNFCGKTKKAVNAAIDKYKLEAATGIKEESDITTFGLWADQWLFMYKEKTVSDSTYRGYALCINHLNEMFEKVPINLITPAMCQAFFARKSDLSSSMLNKIKNTANSIFETAIDNGFSLRNPVKNVKLPKGAPKAEKMVLTFDQADKIKECAKMDPDGFGAFIILSTGVRRGELMGLRVEDFRKGRVYVSRTVQESSGIMRVKYELKNGDRQRIVPIEPTAYEYILSQLPEKGWLFPSKNDADKPMQPGNWVKYILKRFYNNLPDDLPRLNPHELRHTYGTLLYKSGTDARTIQKVMGHKSLDVTMGIYVHDDIEDVEDRIKWSKEGAQGTPQGAHLILNNYA